MADKINWFPGHMKKAVGIIEENLKLVDAVLYVLDARAPFACINPEFDRILKDKPRLYILNKADLVEENSVKAWTDFFNGSDFKAFQSRCIALNSATGVTSSVVRELRTLLGEKIKRYREKGVKKTLRVMVIGVPNSGKSTLINGVAFKKKAATGDKPGVTKSKQWVNIGDGLEMLDTPGALAPRLDDENAAKDLFFIGSIRQEIFDNTELALNLIEKLRKIALKNLEERYKIEIAGDTAPMEILEKIAKSRGCVVKGGEIDIDRAAMTVLDDFKKARTGRICLEMPKREG
ncbi:MAG: ribosome biogenesis GTPase YlqF [Clostridiales bacterium]|jgi:ribosome biogenesis GTPase A|nr:ribosome biogenesis GTPase YlqF [Clostridiales bacterium]